MAYSRAISLARMALELALAAWLAMAVWWLWPRLGLPRLGREECWFAWGWLLVLGVPAALRGLGVVRDEDTPDGQQQTLTASACAWGSFVLGGLFLLLLLAGRGLGNYKLWLGLVYLVGVTLSLTGLSLWMRDRLLNMPGGVPRAALAGAGVSALAGLLMLPWVRPDLVAVWPPQPLPLWPPVAAALMWGGVAAAVLLLLAQGGSARMAWIGYLALGLGMGPALAVTWLPLPLLLAVFLTLAVLAAYRRWRRGPEAATTESAQPLPAYWVLRALMLLWWGAGGAVTLALAWWQPGAGGIFGQADWLRALVMGGFLVGAVGLLAEYSLPLVGGGQAMMGAGPERKVLGMLLTVVALLAALAPLLALTPPARAVGESPELGRARAQLLNERLVLGPDNPEVVLKVPAWLYGLRRVYVVSLLNSAEAVEQGQPVAQLVAVDDQDLPHIYLLRAGIDTAAWDLTRRAVAAQARHEAAPVARSWVVYTPAGEAFTAQEYFTGLYLGGEVNQLATVRLRYIYENQPGAEPVTLDLQRVFVQ